MNDATRFALGIAILLGSMIFLFFAFHPGGVQGINNPGDILKWLIGQFQSAGVAASTAEATGTTQAPGTTTAGGRG